ncbi:hypothetical protein QBC38DRAFT_34047 [Podospora fimiseda]|uniref:C2H2-type domain-containing protein n=1 Tax=Podospora fimiseda TaxID=252190 RepID=A0AAN7GZA1_9PEZI|nr:hypothetical protein QBC38DRAFT_34047 [Podospora fimiseda]
MGKRHAVDGGSNPTSAVTPSSRPACPFAKYEPQQYPKCKSIKLRTFADVRTHLQRCHKCPPYCEICNQIFEGNDGSEHRDEHIKSRQCELPNPEQSRQPPSGIDRDAIDRYFGSIDRKKPLDKKWYELWHLLFPGAPAPQSPYQDDPMLVSDQNHPSDWIENDVESFARDFRGLFEFEIASQTPLPDIRPSDHLSLCGEVEVIARETRQQYLLDLSHNDKLRHEHRYTSLFAIPNEDSIKLHDLLLRNLDVARSRFIVLQNNDLFRKVFSALLLKGRKVSQTHDGVSSDSSLNLPVIDTMNATLTDLPVYTEVARSAEWYGLDAMVDFEQYDNTMGFGADHLPIPIPEPTPALNAHRSSQGAEYAANYADTFQNFGSDVLYAETFQDSGYGSGAATTAILGDGSKVTRPQCQDDEDAGTAWSLGQTVRALNPDMYFASELCDQILGRNFSKAQLGGVLASLPELLWEFSYKIGYESETGRNRDIMKFVHSLAGEIVKRIEDILSDEEDVVGSASDKDKNMNMKEKMELWLTLNEQPQADQGHDYPDQDVQDTDDAPLVHPEDRAEPPLIGVFRDILSQSEAYEWLLSSITSDIRFGVPGSQNIRKEIHDNLIKLAGKSCRCYFKKIKAVFNVSWDYPSFYRLQQFTDTMQNILMHAITITGDLEGNQVQVTSCLEYMAQLWPQTGPRLLNFLGELFQNTISMGKPTHIYHHEGELSDNIQLVAHFDTACLSIQAFGDPFSIAELGTQLAWLGGALFPSTSAGPVSCHPSARFEVAQDADQDSPPAITCWIDYRTYIPEVQSDNSIPPGSCWRAVFGNISVVDGFPIPHRKRQNSGMEATVGIMAALTNVRKLVKFCGMTFIKGFSAMLTAVEVTADTVYWHLFFNKDGDHISYADPRVPLGSPDSDGRDVNIDDPNTRHILGWCVDIKNCTGSREANYSINASGLPPPGSSFVCDRITISGGKFVTVGASIAIGVKQKSLHSQFGTNYIAMLRFIRRRYFLIYDCRDRRAWLVDGASVLLHLVRASLEDILDDAVFRSILRFSKNDFKEYQGPHSGSDTAIDVLIKNRALGLYEGAETSTKETTQKQTTDPFSGSKEEEVVIKRKVDIFSFENAAMDIWERLDMIIGHYDDTSRKDGFGFQVKLSRYSRLQGFDFKDVAIGEATFGPKEIQLQTKGVGWDDFTKTINAITLFGSGFGELYKPAGLIQCRSCMFNSPVPKAKDYLAATVADIENILKGGSKNTVPWCLTGNIHWHTPDKVFEACKCPSTTRFSSPKYDRRVQVLFAKDNPKPGAFKSPTVLEPRGMLVFGKGGVESGNPEKEALEDQASGSSTFQDSGIEMSKSDSSQTPSTGLYSLENTKTIDLPSHTIRGNRLLVPRATPESGGLRARYQQQAISSSRSEDSQQESQEVLEGKASFEALQARINNKRDRDSDDSSEQQVQGWFKRHKGKGKEDGDYE